jgi:ParG protein
MIIIGDDRTDPLDDMSDFTPTPAKAKPPAAAVRKVSEANGFTGNRLPPPAASAPLKRFTIDVSAELHTRIKTECAQRGEKMADVLRELLEREFPENRKSGKS